MRRARLLAAALAALASVALAAPAPAHELGLVQVEGAFRRDGSYALDLLVDLEHLPPATAGKLAPDALLRDLAAKAVLSFDGGAPARIAVAVTPKVNGKANVTRLRLSGKTPPNVSRFTFSDPAISGFFVLKLANEGQERATTQWVEGGKTSAPFALDAAVVPPSRLAIVRLYTGLGFTHILPRGIDHVLFVLGIFLLAVELKPVLAQVTAFTVAHTITLALTMYGVVSLPARVVEPLIAVSIVCVAVENVFTSRLHPWRPALVFAFGLLHGMGFAGVLTEIGLPRSEFVPALLSFNAGVEAGQLTVIGVAFLLFGLPFRKEVWYRRRIVVPASLAIAAIGLYWSVARVISGS